MIEDRKRYGYKTLARHLFKKEVSIFIDSLLNQLIRKEKRMNILSIHDGILCPASEVNDVIEKVESAFKKWDMQVQVTTENIHTGEEQKKILNPLPDWEREPLIKYKMKGRDYAMQAIVD
jgi:hypothetical protein